jgi:CRP-like cAMP-binding protein
MKPDVNQRYNLLCRVMEATIGSRGAIDAREVSLKQGAIVCEAGDPVRQVYFPISCVLLALVPVRDGTMVAITLRGREGAYGLLAAIRRASAPERCEVQIGGSALRISAKQLRSLFHDSTEVRHLFLSYWDAIMHQHEQMSLCNARHSIPSRLSRCLLEIHDRVVGDTFPFTHQHMANLIGANRSTITLAAASLRRSGLIETSRAHVQIIDRSGLRAESCECYDLVTRKFAAAYGLTPGSMLTPSNL